tara:strand:+ start:70 stop:798 length:729 start_codon:yes stop_codon:yes gene_type:complete
MAGHSKWSNIQHRKKAQDAKRGKSFTKFIREIVVAAREGGPDKTANPRLRLAIDKALQGNMTKDTINKAIQRGCGNNDSDNYQSITYEGYGPYGVAILVKCLSDNRNRTVGEVRHAFNKYQGNLGTEGSVAFMFEEKGRIIVKAVDDFEKLFERSLELGADDIVKETDHVFISTPVSEYEIVYASLKKEGYAISEAEITMIPDTFVECGETDSEVIFKLIDALEELDDVQSVFVNAKFPKAQ